MKKETVTKSENKQICIVLDTFTILNYNNSNLM